MQPQPGENQHYDGDWEAEDEPRAEVDDFRAGVTTEITKQRTKSLFNVKCRLSSSRKRPDGIWGLKLEKQRHKY